jgi:hypothetical protein
MKNKLTTIFGCIAAFSTAVPQILVQNGVNLGPGPQKYFALASLIGGLGFAAVAKDFNQSGK